ncbi:MAG: M16 family metallopeptidase [Planctomycetota bacterium]|jgi:zinc protease
MSVPSNATGQSPSVDLPFTKVVLENGLQVVVHEDRSDPVVAVYVLYHVGSGREEVGRSGFAHLFEHLMFQGSSHVGDDQHFKIVSEAGGSLNGTTNRDRTNYFETLPSNQLETALWLESDRMGFLLPAITQEKLDNQREVVKNERRQNYENVPYRQAWSEIMAALYPADHPYHWLTIGSHEDLTAASLEDVHAFFRRWYGPNNATLAIGGDVDTQEAIALARKWFGGIPRGPEVGPPAQRPVRLDENVRLVMEDKVQLPELSLTWPTAPKGHADEAALVMLSSILSANKAAILDRALTIDAVLASRVSASQRRDELAGEFDITVRAAPGVTLDTLEQTVHGLLVQLAADGVDADQLQRQKNRYESFQVNGLETVARRTNALAEANVFFGDPGAATRLLDEVLAVTPAQIDAALRTYLLDRPHVVMSVVPEGETEAAASGKGLPDGRAEVVADAVDRSSRPDAAPAVAFRPPAIWHDEFPSGVNVIGTRYTELPIVSLSLSVPAGHLRDRPETAGLASLTADLMNEGTLSLDTVGMTDALDELGASLRVGSDDDEITISLRTLGRHLPKAAALLQDVVLRPRFDAADFDRLKTQRISALETRGDSIRTIAGNSWGRVLYGKDDMTGWPADGTPDSVRGLTLDQVIAFHRDHVVPTGARLTVVGDVDAAGLRDLFAELATEWSGEAPAIVAQGEHPPRDATRIFLVDKPGAPQSEVRIGHEGLATTDPDWYPVSIMNYMLGGTFSSRINMNLREDKGYTYGARSRFSGGLRPGSFTASSGVRTDVTAESVAEIMKELNSIRDGITEEELAFARDGLMQAMNRQYEAVSALNRMLDSISMYGYPDDYLVGRIAILERITKADIDALAKKYVQPEKAAVLVVGDKEKVLGPLEALGYGPVTELDIDGNPLPETPQP